MFSVKLYQKRDINKTLSSTLQDCSKTRKILMLQTSFRPISTNSLTISTVLMATESP